MIDRHQDGATAFNRKFDFDFLQSRGIQIPQKLPCPMLLATNVCKLPGKFGNYKWPKVEEAYKHFYPDSEYREIHRGADDAMHEADIVLALYRMGIFKIDRPVA
jgi:DNA polymerase-3 subunit epsilon